MSSNSSRPAVEGRGVSRRTLVKGAAHAAWVVPAVQVVSAVPAFACSVPAGKTAFEATSTSSNWRTTGGSGKWRVELSATIKNNVNCAVNGLVVTITAPSSWTGGMHVVNTGGWTVTPNSGSANSFSFTAPSSVGPGNSWTFAPTVRRTNDAQTAGSISGTATWIDAGTKYESFFSIVV